MYIFMIKEMLHFLKKFLRKKTINQLTIQNSWKCVSEQQKKKGKDILSDDCNHIVTYLQQWHILNYTFFFL